MNKMMRCLKRWQLAILCLAVAILLPAVPVRRGQTQAVTYTVTDLGTLGGTQSFAYGLNACGRVVGRSSIASSDGNFHPFVGSEGQLTDIAPDKDNGVANAINDLGFVAGAISGEHAFIWSAASGRQDIGVLPGGVASSAADINEHKVVVGISEINTSGQIRGFVWQQSTGIQAIGTFGGASSAANAVNNAGTVVGSAQNASGVSHAFTLDGGVLSDLSTLGGSSSVANGINDVGEVVGSSDVVATSGRPFHAFIWSSTSGMLDMGTLNGSTRSAALDINNAGQAVGYSILPTGRHAFIYTRTGGMSDLNDLVPGSGWVFQEAQAINERGQIVGIGNFESDPDHQRAFMLTPDNAGPSPCSQAGSLQFDAAAYSVAESGLKRTVTVTRTGGFGGAVSVDYATSDGTATTAGSDYQATSGTLSFAEGETSKTFDVSINDDALFEANETVNLTLSNPQGSATLGTPNTAVLTINDNDAAPSFTIDDVTQAEGNAGQTSFTFTVTKLGATALPASVQFNTADGTATTADGDYVSNSGTLNFAANEPTRQLVVNVNGDKKFEADETFTINLSNPSGATIGDNQATGTITNDDALPAPGTLQFSAPAYGISEGSTTATINVTRTGGSDGAVSVSYSTSNGTAIAGQDYVSTSGTLSFADGETQKSFTVAVNEDTLDEADETVNLTLSSPGGGATLGTQSAAVLTIEDNDAAPSLSINDVAVAEGDVGTVTATFTVTLSAASALSVGVNYATADGSATAVTDDYLSFSSTPLTFSPGQTSKTVSVTVKGDTFYETDEVFFVNLSGATNATIADGQGQCTITNDDAQPTLQFSSLAYGVGEGDGKATITVIRSGGTNGGVTVNYSASAGTATGNGVDFSNSVGTLTFTAGDLSKTIDISINDDAIDEENETVNLTLSNPGGGGVLGSASAATLTINDNDAPPSILIGDPTVAEGNSGTLDAVFAVAIPGGSGKIVTVNYTTADGTANAPDDYTATNGTLTFNPGETQKSVNVPLKGDTVFEPDETFFVNLSSPTNATIGDAQGQGTITNDDSPPTLSINDVTQTEGNAGTTSFTFTVTKTGATVLPASAAFATANGTATTADADYTAANGVVGFTAGETSKQITVNVVGDTKFEPDELFLVNLFNPTGATIADGQGRGTITNDDAAPVFGALQFSAPAYSVVEGATTATINVTRTGGSDGAVSVSYSTSNGTALAGQDYVSTSGTLSFADGETQKSFTVAVVDDGLNEADETVNLTLSNPQGGAALGAPGTAVLTITNDDTPRVQFSAAAFAADESAHLKVINVTRTGDVSLPATVEYMSADGTASERNDYTFAFGTLRFAAGEVSKSFELLLTDDAFTEGDETINLTLSNPTGGAVVGTQGTAVVTIVANDNPPPQGNPLDDPGFFVRMHYHDFLGRRPDNAGLDFWTGNITSCGVDEGCREVKRINVSGAFFLSIEFQNTGYLVERMYKTAYGDADGTAQFAGAPVRIPVPVIRRSEFLIDSAIIRDGVVVNVGDWEQVLENNKNAFALAFVRRQRFVDAYATSLTPAAFVQKLNQNTGNSLTPAEAAALVAEFGGAADTADVAKRASVFRKVAENAELDRRERNRAFVLMQYFGYLQRDPNAAPDADHTGWKFWLDKLEQFGGDFQQAEMVKAFISSGEYRQRFGP